ncbi:putative reverse transcriptase domain-containing protein [Tanacetum coccineum]
MSDSEDSTVTYTEVSNPFEGLLDIGSPGVVGSEYEGLPWMLDDPYVQVILQASPSPDYVPGPEEPEQAPPLSNFVPEPVYPEFMPPEDEVFPAEEQPLPVAASPTADSPGYVPESDSKEDPEEDPADEGDDGDDKDESFDDDEDDDVDIKEEEEYPALVDSTVVALPAVDHALSAKETGPFETDESAATPPPHPAYRVTSRMSIRDEPPIPFWSKAYIARLLAIPSPLSPWSSPLPQIPSPPLLVSPPSHVSPPPLPDSPIYPLGYIAAMIRLRAEAPSTSHPLPLPSPIAPPSGTPPLLPIPLLTPSPPLLLPSTDHRAGVREACLPPRKRLCFAFGPRYEVGESSSAPIARPNRDFKIDYGFIATLDDEIMRDPERDVGYWIINTWHEMLDTDKIYGRLDDAQTELHMVTSRVNMLFRDRHAHARIARLKEIEARMSREAWGRSMDASDLTCTDVMALRTQVVAQQSEITELRATDRKRQTQLIEALKLMKTIQTQLTALRSRQRPARGPAQLDAPEEAGVTAALAARDAIRSTNGEDNHNSGTGVRTNERATRECTYPDFMKCQPLNFKGTEGVVELTQWVEKMETVFRISNCSVENQIKFSTCTLLGNALTWWNSHVKTVGNDVDYEMTWTELKKKMTDKYCPRTEIKKLKVKLWDLKVKESDKIERYVSGLPDMIHRSIVASKPKTMQKATEIATELMDKRIRTFADRQTKNKRKQDNNQQQQLQNKRQNTDRDYAAGTGKKKLYGGSKPLCHKCNYHHDGLCAPKCHKYNRVGHLARDCRSPANANTAYNQRGTGTGQKPTCYECGAQGHFKRECPKLKNNNNQGNPAGNVNALAKVYAVGHAGTNPDSNVVTGTFLLNNRYASILFDTGADRSFVSTAFSSQIDITPTALDHYYDVELADERIIGLNTILRGCTLNILNHPFNIDLMPVELGSFDAIIGMDWLVKYQAIIVCAKKIIRIP